MSKDIKTAIAKCRNVSKSFLPAHNIRENNTFDYYKQVIELNTKDYDEIFSILNKLKDKSHKIIDATTFVQCESAYTHYLRTEDKVRYDYFINKLKEFIPTGYDLYIFWTSTIFNIETTVIQLHLLP